MRSATELRLARGVASCLVVVLAGVLLHASPARSDGDPASDVLLGQNVFYPYIPPVSTRLQISLNAETAAARRAQFPIKVALIAGPSDLGVVPQLFGRPQAYADFLDQELRLILGPHTSLLVVMPSGYGFGGLPTATTAVAGTLPKPAGRQTNDLARAAILAVRKLAAAAGHPITAVAGSAGAATGSGASALTVLIVVLVAVAIAGAVLVVRRRRALARSAR